MGVFYRTANAVLPELFRLRVKRAVQERIRRPITAAVINLLGEIIVAARTPISRMRFRALRTKKDLKVHLGCGADIRPGWINIDLGLTPWSGVNTSPRHGATVIKHDLRRGLPLEADSCDFIYSSHFFEHLEYRYGLKLMRDCYRVLRPGGIFRAALPNFRGGFDAYLRGDYKYVELINIFEVLPDVEPGTETLVDHINYGVYQHGEHKCIYDEEKFMLVLRRIGFNSVSTSSYQEGIDPDDPVRQRYSFYIEAVK